MTVTIARSVDEALAALASDPSATVLAGGTDLMVEVNFGHRRPERIVTLDRIAELQRYEIGADSIVIGAGVTYAALERAPFTDVVPALAQAARTVGSPQIRNAGTIGGNVGTGSPAGDTLPVLAALDATIELRRADGGGAATRLVPWREFFVAPKRTALQPGELVVAVHLPLRRGPQQFLKVGTRNAMVIAVASVCVIVDLDHRRVSCALGSVGPTPLRAAEAEAFATAELAWSADGVRASAAVCARFGELAAAAARPIDDHRGTARYRQHAIGVCATRALRRASEG